LPYPYQAGQFIGVAIRVGQRKKEKEGKTSLLSGVGVNDLNEEV
jgi:hypothetical protein